MSTVLEIESAIANLPLADEARLRNWLGSRATSRPKTGAELAALWPSRFHLTAAEAEEMARDLEADRRLQVPPAASAWE